MGTHNPKQYTIQFKTPYSTVTHTVIASGMEEAKKLAAELKKDMQGQIKTVVKVKR